MISRIIKIIDGRAISFFLIGFIAEKSIEYGIGTVAPKFNEAYRLQYQELLLNTIGNEPYKAYKDAYLLVLEMRNNEIQFKSDKSKIEKMHTLMQKASDGDIPQAQYWLSRMYCGGFGIEKNISLSFYYMNRASENNLPIAKKYEANPCLN